MAWGTKEHRKGEKIRRIKKRTGIDIEALITANKPLQAPLDKGDFDEKDLQKIIL